MASKDQEKHNKEMMEEHLSLSVTELAATKISIVSFRKQLAANKLQWRRDLGHNYQLVNIVHKRQYMILPNNLLLQKMK